MSIDGAIEHAREVAEIQRNNDKLNKTLGKSSPYYNTDCIKCAEEHEQLADWLEELKEARHCMEENRKAGYNHGFVDGYNKAIDDFLKNLYKIGEHRDFDWEDMYKLAEQLKVGKNNGTDNQ